MNQALPALPPIGGPSPCQGCHGPCCSDADVPLDAHDLSRLCRTLELDWTEIATRSPDPDGDTRAPRFRLRRDPSGACIFLLRLPGGYQRCGVHALRPSSCRVYPYHVQLLDDAASGYGATVGENAACPAAPAREFQRRATDALPLLDEEIAEDALHRRLLTRWAELGSPTSPTETHAFVGWSSEVYQAIAPLRRGERGEWQLTAYRLVASFPLPLATVI